MNKVAIAFSTKDRAHLSRRSVVPLLQQPFDLFWSDGSDTEEGEKLPYAYSDYFPKTPSGGFINSNVRGGADAAIVFNLTTMLNHPNKYTHVGLVENDVLLDDDWFMPTMDLFEQGKNDGLEVGAVSARAYEDRVLIQRSGYAVMHNLGAGMVIFTRRAAELVLKYFRTGWTTENRRTFMQLSGIDIGRYWAFRGNQHMTCADWQFDRILAQHGLASLALTPSKAQMIGQEPSLEQQGLKLVTEEVEDRRDDNTFMKLKAEMEFVRSGVLRLPALIPFYADDGSCTFFPHQLSLVGGEFKNDWSLKWSQGFGPFSYKAGVKLGRVMRVAMTKNYVTEKIEINDPTVLMYVSGPCTLLVSGGDKGGNINVKDIASGYEITTELVPEGPTGQVMQLAVPAAVSYRRISLTAVSPGICFYGLVTREPQPTFETAPFNHTMLPPV